MLGLPFGQLLEDEAWSRVLQQMTSPLQSLDLSLALDGMIVRAKSIDGLLRVSVFGVAEYGQNFSHFALELLPVSSHHHNQGGKDKAVLVATQKDSSAYRGIG